MRSTAFLATLAAAVAGSLPPTCQNLLKASNLDWRRSYAMEGYGYARNVQWNDITDPYGHQGTTGTIDAVSNVVSWQPRNPPPNSHADCNVSDSVCSATYWYNYDNFSAIPAPASTDPAGSPYTYTGSCTNTLLRSVLGLLAQTTP